MKFHQGSRNADFKFKSYFDLKWSYVFAGLVCSIGALIFLPMALSKFGRLDDFSFYFYTRNDVSGVIKSGFSYGRPITSLVIGKAFGSVDSVDDFTILRVLSIGLLCASIIIMVHFYSKKEGSSKYYSILILFLFLSLPGIWVFMTWAQGLPHLMGLMFVSLAVIGYASDKAKWSYYLFSFLAFFTYQPFGLIIPIILVSKILKNDSVNYLKESAKIFVWITLLAASNFCFVKFQTVPNERSNLTSDVLEKLHWMATQWIPRTLFPWELRINAVSSILSLIFFMFFAISYILKSNLKQVAILFMALLYPSIPFLLSNENWSSSRAILSSNIAYLICIIFLISESEFSKKRNLIFDAFLGVFVVILLITSVRNGYAGLVFPQTREWTRTIEDLKNYDGDVKEIRVQLAPFEQTSSEVISYDEFGILNSSVDYPLIGMVMMARNQVGLNEAEVILVSTRECQTKRTFLDPESRVLFLSPLAGVKGCR